MAVNVQKFLPPPKSGALAKITAKQSSVSISEKSQENLSIIKVKSIEVDKLLKGTLASEKKQLDEKKKKDTQKRRDDVEERLEKKPKAEKGSIKMPSLPRMRFLDWIKNFIGNIILGYFAVRLVDHLPKLIPIAKLIGKATDFAIDFGGKLLDGLATFIDVGYKAVDATRNLVGKTFGEDALKNFDLLTGEFEKFMNIAIIVGMASADFGMNRLKGKGTEKAAGTVGRGGAGRAATRAATRVGGKGAGKLTSKIGAKALKVIPLLGAGLSIAEGIMRIREGDYVGGLLSFGTAIPVAGWAFLALDVAREFMGGREFDKSVGKAFSGTPGLTDKQVQKRTPSMSGPSFMGLAGGGITRGGKSQRRPSRTIRKSSKGKYKRVVPKKPGEVEITSPGSDVGGEDKIFGLFPNPFKMAQNAIDMMNPFNVIKKAGKNLGDSDYFGPILAITAKILLGQKPSQSDYKNVGLGINLLIAKGIDDGKIKGGLAAAFAGGGFVDPSTLNAISEGGDISDWVATSFKDATETNAQKTLREIQENLRLKSPTQKEMTAPKPQDLGEGADIVVSSDSEDFWLLATAAMFENSDPQGAADVAQVIYNRTQYSAWNAPTLRKAILNPNQFQPVSQYGGTGAWSKIKTKDDAIRFAKSYGKTQDQLERVAAALLDPSKQQSAKSFVGPRDSFRATWFEDKNNHLADETEVRRHGHVFGFEPGGAMIGQFKAGKLSAAQVSAGIVGTVDQSGLPSLPPTGTLSGQNYGDPREGGRKHAGQDYDAPPNGTFYSRIGGEVKFIGNEPGGYYKYVDIYNPQLGVTERIAEGDNILVRLGQKVSRGTPVASGTNSTGVFHYEIRRGSGTTYGFEGTIDPKKFLGNMQKTSKFHGGIGISPSDGFTLKLHKGEMYKVVDKDSVDLFGKELVQDIIDIENKSQLIAKAPSIIEKLKAISGYTSYESDSDQTVVIMEPPVNIISAGEGGESSPAILFAGAEEEDPFDFLYASS